MFFILFLSSQQAVFNYTCVSQLKHADPIPGAKLYQVITMTRHGCRAPFNGYANYTASNWTCDSENAHSPRMSTSTTKTYRRYRTAFEPERVPYPPSCRMADLTIEGMNQHHDMGEFYHKYLVDEMNLLPDYLNPDFLYLRSSEPERCIRSAESFLNGLYPPDYENELLKLITGTNELEMLHPRVEHCKDFWRVYEDWIKSDKYIAKKENARKYLEKLILDSGEKYDDWHWLWVGDWIYTIGCCGSPIPDIPQDALDISMDAVEFFTLDLFQRERGVAGAPIIREVLRVMEPRVTGDSNVAFGLLSSHDVGIVAALNVLGINLSEIPPFRSHLAFELWKSEGKFLVRVVLNGLVVYGPVSFAEFRREVAPFLHFCPEL